MLVVGVGFLEEPVFMLLDFSRFVAGFTFVCQSGTGGGMLSAEVPGFLGFFRAGWPIAWRGSGGFRELRG